MTIQVILEMKNENVCSKRLNKEAAAWLILLQTILNDQLGFIIPSYLTIIVMLLVLIRVRKFIRNHKDNTQLVKV
jgi:hypothetical protein